MFYIAICRYRVICGAGWLGDGSDTRLRCCMLLGRCGATVVVVVGLYQGFTSCRVGRQSVVSLFSKSYYVKQLRK